MFGLLLGMLGLASVGASLVGCWLLLVCSYGFALVRRLLYVDLLWVALLIGLWFCGLRLFCGGCWCDCWVVFCIVGWGA